MLFIVLYIISFDLLLFFLFGFGMVKLSLNDSLVLCKIVWGLGVIGVLLFFLTYLFTYYFKFIIITGA